MLFGNADVQQASGLPSPYEQLWTLPMRTLDPHLAQLRAVLRGPAAPTWVVAWGDLDPWNIDAHGRTRLAAGHALPARSPTSAARRSTCTTACAAPSRPALPLTGPPVRLTRASGQVDPGLGPGLVFPRPGST